MDVPMRDVTVVPMTDAHARAVLAIYQAGIDSGNATFEPIAPDWLAFCTARLPRHRFVALTAGRVVGWVACARVSTRAAYAGVVEHSVYVAPDAAGQGVGRALMEELIASTEGAGLWMITSSVFPENRASLALHEAVGFRRVGVRERIGWMDGRWRDTVVLERRSRVVGEG